MKIIQFYLEKCSVEYNAVIGIVWIFKFCKSFQVYIKLMC